MRSEQTGGPGLLGPLLLLLCCGDAGLQHTSATAAYGRAPLLVRVLASHEVAAAVAWNAARRRTHVSIVSTEYSRYDCAMRGMS